MRRLFGSVGVWTLQRLADIGQATVLFVRLVLLAPSCIRRFGLVRDHMHFLGNYSLAIIAVSGLFVGFVLALQGYNTLQRFGSASALGLLVALSLVRELGPVVSALLFTGRAGTSLTAEIGLMKATEQLDSMDMMGVDPLGRIIFPRFIAGMISLPILSLIFSAIAIYGGYIIGVLWLGLDPGSFWSNMQAAVNFHIDVFSGIIKSIVFSFLVIWIALFQGFSCVPTAEGISQATTRTVVSASLAILGFDFLLTAMMIGGW